MNKWHNSIVIQGKKEGNQFIKTEGTSMITDEQRHAQKEFQAQKKKLMADILEIQRKLREIERNDRKVKRFVDKILGKSKVDLYFEKLVDTPRKRKLLKNKGVHVVSKEYFDERKEDITKTILSYLGKYENVSNT